MSKRKIDNYTFDASARQITFTDYATIRLDSILIIVNSTDQIIIYNFADTAKGGTVATNVLTLEHDTTTMNDADKLLIYYDDTDYDATEYVEGDTDATIKGKAILWEDTANTLRAVSATKPLPSAVYSATGAAIESVSGTHMGLVVHIDNLVTATVDINSPLPAGTNNIGDIDVLTLPDVDINDISKGTQTHDIKVTLDGEAITANAGTNLNTSALALETTLQSVKTAVEIIDNFISGARGLVTEDNSNAIKTALEIIDDWDETDKCKVQIKGDDVGLALAANQLIDGHNVTVDNASGASAVNIQDGGNVITIDGTVTASDTAGDIAHDAADLGNPIKVGHKAVLFNSSAPPNAAVAENDRVNSIADEYGRQYVEATHPNYWDVSADYAAAQTNTTVKAAPGAGLSLYITDIIISNGATVGNITLLDGSGGTVLLELYVGVTGGATHSFKSPIKLTANTLLAITSVLCTTHSITICGFTAP